MKSTLVCNNFSFESSPPIELYPYHASNESRDLEDHVVYSNSWGNTLFFIARISVLLSNMCYASTLRSAYLCLFVLTYDNQQLCTLYNPYQLHKLW